VKRLPEVERLTVDLHRLSMMVSGRFLGRPGDARNGLSHHIPGATAEQVLEAALELLPAMQARAQRHPARDPRSRSLSRGHCSLRLSMP
jgi:hypothetical protein